MKTEDIKTLQERTLNSPPETPLISIETFRLMQDEIGELRVALKERDAGIRQMGEDLIAIQSIHDAQKAAMYSKLADQRAVMRQALDALERLSESQLWTPFIPDAGFESDPWKPVEQYGLNAIAALNEALK